MFVVSFGSKPAKDFPTLDAAAEFMTTVKYRFIRCTDPNGDDCSISLCQLIVKKLKNNNRLDDLKEDF